MSHFNAIKQTSFCLLLTFAAASSAWAQCPYSGGGSPRVAPTVYPIYQPTPVYQPTIQTVSIQAPPSPRQQASTLAGQAKGYFQQARYPEAFQAMNSVVRLVPKDGGAVQFRSLVAFASGDFKVAAADAYDAMSTSNAWTPKMVRSMYGAQVNQYPLQIQRLEQTAQAKPSMQVHFLLAYHYLMNERIADAKLQLNNVLKFQPNEPLSTKLLAVVNKLN